MKTKLLFVLFLIGIALFNSGCIDEGITVDHIAEKMQEKQANIEDYSATMHMTVSIGDQVQEMEYEIIQKNPGKSRMVVMQPEELAGSITVCNGEKMWIYEPNTNSVRILEVPEIPELSEMNYANIIGDILNETDVSMVGTSIFDGRDTYIIRVKTKENESGNPILSNMDIWVDKETWIPLRIEISIEEEYQSIIEYRNFKVNTGITDEEFEFEIPEGAEVINIGDFENLLPEEITLEEAQDASKFDIILPSYLPEGYEFNYAMLINNTIGVLNLEEAVTLTYSNSENVFIISEKFYEGEKEADSIMGNNESVFINDVEGKLYTMYGDFKMLQWEIGNAMISISGFLEEDELIKIAESMD
ncbi:MAG: DUF4367 domain-containing protein [Methanosarcinaceae archaeon]|nr:DUF4367 domain-containing protein [Methanosarcinaceae archaeon]